MGQSAGTRVVTTDLAAVDDAACTVLHVDMDAFFAFVELRRRPELRGVPMMVAGDSGGRGVVLSASYEARVTGIRSGMPTGQAVTLCPHIVVVPPDQQLYRDVSREVMAIFADVTPVVEPLSVDEAFLDVAGARRSSGRPAEIAARLRRRISDELQLTATVGAAGTKFIAKLASGLAKPDGLLVVPPDQVLPLLHPLGVRALWGVGPKAEKTLHALGLTTVGDVAAADPQWLRRRLGTAVGSKLYELAWARDDRPVTPVVAEQSIGAETTFGTDTADIDFLARTLLGLADRTARRARAAGLRGRTVGLKVRFADFTTVTRAVTLPTPTDLGAELYTAAVGLLRRLDLSPTVRLIGVRLEGLTDTAEHEQQLSFDELAGAASGTNARPGSPEPRTAASERVRRAETTVDAISARFGASAVRPASLLPPSGHAEPTENRR